MLPFASAAQRLGAALAAVVITTAAGAGCYRPTIQEGGFKCNVDGKACPDGYLCDTATNTCRHSATSPTTDARMDVPAMELGGSDGPADLHPDRVDSGACLTPKPGCTAHDGGLCDPMCQTGCGCHEKCSSNTAGALTCNPPLGDLRRTEGESCNISGSGATQTDNCEPGLVCVTDSCASRCYRFCRTDQDCPNSTCSRDAGGGVKICDVPFVACNPVRTNNQPSGCAASAQGCYLSATAIDKTLCDCPFAAVGSDGSCTRSRDCLPGLACVDPTNQNIFICRQVCSLSGGGRGCPSGICRAYNGSTTYGYCSN